MQTAESSKSHEKTDLLSPLYAHIRRDVADTFSEAIKDADLQASSALHSLNGDVQNWAKQFDQKLNVTTVEIFHALSWEINNRMSTLDKNVTERQKSGLGIVHDILKQNDGKQTMISNLFSG